MSTPAAVSDVSSGRSNDTASSSDAGVNMKKRRSKNRVNARRSRERKRMMIDTLQQEHWQLRQDNKRVREDNYKLRDAIDSIKSLREQQKQREGQEQEQHHQQHEKKTSADASDAGASKPPARIRKTNPHLAQDDGQPLSPPPAAASPQQEALGTNPLLQVLIYNTLHGGGYSPAAIREVLSNQNLLTSLLVASLASNPNLLQQQQQVPAGGSPSEQGATGQMHQNDNRSRNHINQVLQQNPESTLMAATQLLIAAATGPEQAPALHKTLVMNLLNTLLQHGPSST